MKTLNKKGTDILKEVQALRDTSVSCLQKKKGTIQTRLPLIRCSFWTRNNFESSYYTIHISDTSPHPNAKLKVTKTNFKCHSASTAFVHFSCQHLTFQT